LNFFPHPSQAPEEDVGADGKRKLSYRFVLIFGFRAPEFFFSAAALPLLSFYLLPHFLYVQYTFCNTLQTKSRDPRDFTLPCLPFTEAFGAC
jgi:hypothetical protein